LIRKIKKVSNWSQWEYVTKKQVELIAFLKLGDIDRRVVNEAER